ncbi:uncharacterized protein [Anabrus simplex]|uniref:uncharacterized protein isoform X2 n=1 Tax=Anabrus simplex TaxID=316456 RepID=UPI0035A2E97E
MLQYQTNLRSSPKKGKPEHASTPEISDELPLLGTACVGMICYVADNRSYRYYLDVPERFFMLMSVAFLIGTFCLLLSCILSLSAGTVIAKTVYEVIYHGLAFILYLAASLTLLIEVQKYTSRYSSSTDIKLYQAASIVGLVNTVLYLMSTVFAYRSYKFV